MEMKKLVVNGVEYTVADPDAACIDDTKAGADAWSGKHIADRLCPGFSVGGSAVTCTPLEGYPLRVVSHIEPVQEGSGDPAPGGWSEVSKYLDDGAGGDPTHMVLGDFVDGKKYRIIFNAQTGSGERAKIASAEIYQANGPWGSPIACTVGDYYVEFTMRIDQVGDPMESDSIDITLTYTEEVYAESMFAYDEMAGVYSLVDGALIFQEYDPGNLRPITGHSAVKLWRSGRNLFDFKQDATLITYYTVAGAERQKHGFIVPLAAGTYTFSTFDNKVIDIATTTRYVWLYIINSEKWISSTLDKPLNGASFIGNITFDMPENCSLLVINGGSAGANTVFTEEFNYQLEVGSAPTAYEPYRGGEFTFDLGQTVWGGSLDWESGLLTVTHGVIDSYAGEAVPEGWVSSTGALSEGAQVVYPLEEPVTVRLTPREILALSGTNTLYSDTGDTQVTGRADLQTILQKLMEVAANA